MTELDLNNYSTRVAKRLFAAHPEWRAHARAESSDDDGHHLVVEIAPPPNGRAALVISTKDDEISITYDRWHAHYDSVPKLSEDEVGAAIQCVDEILAEDAAIVVTMQGERWRGSRLLYRSETAPQPKQGQQVYIRSWRGSRDASVPAG